MWALLCKRNLLANPVERRGRKVTGLKSGGLHDSGIAGYANYHGAGLPVPNVPRIEATTDFAWRANTTSVGLASPKQGKPDRKAGAQSHRSKELKLYDSGIARSRTWIS